MPCPHFDGKIVQRSNRQSAVASAAYQSGERLFSEYDQKQKYYSHKSEIVHTEIMLPPHAPRSYTDRNTLWNATEAIEKQWNSQLARRFVLAIPRELSPEQYADLIRDYCREFFVSKGMIADFAIHDKGDGNPHAHILLTLRAMDEQGKWLPKSRKVYDLDENGERIRLPSGNWKSHKEVWNQQRAERNDFMARKDNRGRNLKVGESQRKVGLYMYRYTDERTGKRVAIYDADLTALREKERQIAREMDDGIVTDRAAKKLTVNALFERYIESKKLADSTRGNYIATWNNRVRDEIGGMKVVQVRPSHIRLFYSRLTKDGYSHSTIKLIHNLLYPSFKMAVDDDIIRKNPAKDALGNNGEPAKEKMALTPSQQNRLLSFVERSSVYNVYLRMLQIMIGTGWRCGELIGLTWADVDMKKKESSL